MEVSCSLHADDTLDTDGDGVMDCLDSCPDDVNVLNEDTGVVFGRLKDAIAASSPGDTLLLGACVFDEGNLVLDNRDITIRGAGMGMTVIDGSSVDPVEPLVGHRPGDASTWEDLTIREFRRLDGNAAVAIEVDRAAPVYRRVEITGIDPGSPGIVFSAFEGNVTIDSCVFSDVADRAGSVVDVLNGERVLIANTVFDVGIIDTGKLGGAVVQLRPFGAENTHTVANCTFVGDAGSAAYISAFNANGSVKVVNTVFDAVVGNVLFAPNADVTVVGSVHPSLTGDNVSAAPVFVDAANGDYRLAAGSPGIDAGDASAYSTAGGGIFDVLGNNRVVDDPATADASSLPIDAGAFEFQPVPQSGDCPADLALPFGITDLADVDAFIASFLAGCP